MLRLKTVLVSVLATSLVVANVTASKVAALSLGPLDVIVPAGFVGIAVAFLATDVLSEQYGKEEARSAVNSAIVSLGVAWALVYSAILLPAAPFYPLAAEFASIMGQSASIVAASIITLLVSQNVDVSVFHAIRDRVPHKFARNIGSTAISQAVDTTMFIGLGFVAIPAISGGDPMPLMAAWSLIVGQYIVKLGIVALDTPLFYVLTR